MTIPIQRYAREGAWFTEYISHFRTAKEFLAISLQSLQEYEAQSKRLLEEHDEESYVRHHLRGLEETIIRYATASEVFCCLTIEGFVNLYGTRRLGQHRYMKEFRKSNMVQKVSGLLYRCQNKALPPNHPLLKNVRDLFKVRNKIVHPVATEAKAMKGSEVLSVLGLVKNAELHYNNTIEFFKLLSELDPDVDWKSELWMDERVLSG